MLCVGALFVVKTAKLYFMQIQFSGRKNKSSQRLENERENAWKYFLFWTVCAIMTLVLGKETENCTHEAYSVKRSVIIS